MHNVKAALPSKIVCVGRNYVDHIVELNNVAPSRPLLFMKPTTALSQLPDVVIPTNQGECQHEVEIAVQIGSRLQRCSPEGARQAISAYGLALDLTLRQVQSELKASGHPWERAKAFDGSCALSEWVNATEIDPDQPLAFSLQVNDQLRQHGTSAQMIYTIVDLIADISQQFTLLPGDVVLTGTPAGVAALANDDRLQLKLWQGNNQWQWTGRVRCE